jgi:hypothetical protein
MQLLHAAKPPHLVQLDTLVAVFIAFAVACGSTAIQGLIAHAFRKAIGDIIVTDNSLGDMDRIAPMIRSNIASLAGKPWSGEMYAVHTVMDSFAPAHPQRNTPQGGLSSGKRLDARGFFQSLPMSV